MAFRELVDGDCGGRNPMLKVASHFTKDQAFRQDVAVSHRHPDTRPEDVMVREFLEGIPPPSQVGTRGAFNMESLLCEMRDFEKSQGVSRLPIQAGPNVAHYAFDDKSWAEDFLRKETHVIPEDIPSASGWSQEFLDSPGYMGAVDGDSLEWDTHWDSLTSHIEKPKFTAPDALAQTAGEIIDRMKDPKFAQSEFLQFMQRVSQGEENLTTELKSTAAYGNSNWAEEFAGADGVIKQPESSSDQDWAAEFTTNHQPDLAEEWTKEFSDGASAEVFRSGNSSNNDFWSQLQQDWEKAADDNPSSYGWLKETQQDTLNEYSFEAENPYQDISDPYNAGLQKRLDGDLPSAILLFEAALQKDPDHMKAWEVLGLTLAENEQDPGAITAYKRCLALEPTNLVAIMGLAVSYTNESYQLQACQALEDWLRNNPKYAHLTSSSSTSASEREKTFTSLVSGDTFNRVQDMYLRAARLQPSHDLDPDVQTGLGVLLNLSGDFDKAPDCFRSALQMKPNDSLLWNRLGATLGEYFLLRYYILVFFLSLRCNVFCLIIANGGRSEEAIESYYKALELSPGFIRARYNLAVSCINLGAHREAAEHLVSALLLQARRSKRVMSDNIWSTLRMVLNLMNRREFIADIDAKDLTRLAAEFGIAE
ncbi:peroxisomal targeting signal 1 receptor-like isoform X1 [Daphnia carinata]|uniref:peroxisomal targeting signal 1 receptor-like isoform X1 n=1 Tax=Daphnia carinata TaxID=120202 RepID=UPI00257BE833|nr:peroxisomal targeting signal 1 receptor-like isoform X1 [Daphnia carinata]